MWSIVLVHKNDICTLWESTSLHHSLPRHQAARSVIAAELEVVSISTALILHRPQASPRLMDWSTTRRAGQRLPSTTVLSPGYDIHFNLGLSPEARG